MGVLRLESSHVVDCCAKVNLLTDLEPTINVKTSRRILESGSDDIEIQAINAALFSLLVSPGPHPLTVVLTLVHGISEGGQLNLLPDPLGTSIRVVNPIRSIRKL